MSEGERSPSAPRNVIAMAGHIGSGKSEVCRELSRRTGWEIISGGAILRRMASERCISVLEMNEYAKSHPLVDVEIDENLIALAQSSKSLIVDSRMAWHFVPFSFKVYLVVEPLIAAQRVFRATRPGEKYASVESTFADNEERQRLERERYKKLYSVDCENWRNYDLIVDTTYVSPGDIATRVLEEARTGQNTESSVPRCWLSPKRLIPTQTIRELADPRATAVWESVQRDGFRGTSVDIAVYRGSCLIIDGHARVSAALRHHELLIPCRVIAFEEEAIPPGLTVPEFAMTSTSLSWIYDWEDAHAFEFASYPNWLVPDGLGHHSNTRPIIGPTEDRDEPVSIIEPLLITDVPDQGPDITELVLELAQKSAGLRRSLPTGLLAPLAGLLRAMNCYYSNLIEGHDTHPVDIERALKDDFSLDSRKRDLQLEAKAHIAVQEWVDSGGLKGRTVKAEGICELHRRFCELLPEDLLQVEEPATKERLRVVPGAFRTCDVAVGRHRPISPGAIPRFLQRFGEVYGNLGKSDTISSAAAAHHRLLWIHPFLDGNGRVARLMSHAMLLDTLDTGAIWSVARGLARHVRAYETHLANCDQPSSGDFEGRGKLSGRSIVEFTKFFLRTCIDEVAFMESLVQADRLRTRIILWAEEAIRLRELPRKSASILEAVLCRGELTRGDAALIVQTSDRQARRIVATLIEKGILTSTGPHAPLCLAFPATLAPRWMPGLFPDRIS